MSDAPNIWRLKIFAVTIEARSVSLAAESIII